MKKTLYAFLVLSMLTGSIGVLSAFADSAMEAKEHLALAASYDQKVSDLDAVINEHKQMKSNYKTTFNFDGKFSRGGTMDSHCDAIVEKSEALKNEYKMFAEDHRNRAAELQGVKVSM